MENSPLISIIIPTYNSSNTIEKCLISIKNQSYNNYEILVIDNNSKDNTKEISLKYTSNVFNKWPERTFQKNYWIEKSNWNYIFFVDSDMQLDSNILKDCIELYKNSKNIWWICIPEISIWEWFFVKVRDYERSFYWNTSIESARFFLLEDVKNVWWFEEDLIFFEESLLPQKIEAKLKKSTKFRIQSYISHNEWDIKLFKWLSKKFYYWKSLNDYKIKVKEIWIKETWNNQMWIISRYMIFLKNKRFYKKPVLAICVITLKTLEFWSWALGLIFSKIK